MREATEWARIIAGGLSKEELADLIDALMDGPTLFVHELVRLDQEQSPDRYDAVDVSAVAGAPVITDDRVTESVPKIDLAEEKEH